LRVSESPYLSVIVPAYNEAGCIRETLNAMQTFLEVQPYTYEIIIAADGDDGTAEIAREIATNWPNMQVTAEAGRHGKGHGLRRGMRLARGDVVGFLDADYKTPIEELDKLLPWLDKGFEVVVGSRGVRESHVKRKQRWYRQIGSRIFGIGMHAIVGLHHIRDTQCGFKFFRGMAAREIFQRTRIDGYMCDVEILWLAERLGYRAREVGILWRDDGDSRLELVRGNIRNLVDLLRIRFSRYADGPALIERPLAEALAQPQADH
jgi:dolichyl-phosphate beta-glucosyltransferase